MATLSDEQEKLLKTLIRRWTTATRKHSALSAEFARERKSIRPDWFRLITIAQKMGIERGMKEQAEGIAQQMGIIGELRAGISRKVQQDDKPHADC